MNIVVIDVKHSRKNLTEKRSINHAVIDVKHNRNNLTKKRSIDHAVIDVKHGRCKEGRGQQTTHRQVLDTVDMHGIRHLT